MGRPVTSARPHGQPAQTAKPLPELRQDLRLLNSPSDMNGGRRWLIHDPLQHRYFSIGYKAHVLLQLWQPGATADAVIEAAWEQYAEPVDLDGVARFSNFLQASGLTLEAGGGGWRGYLTEAERRRGSWAGRLLHNYLFFRVPLFRPERFLADTIDVVRPLGTRAFAALVVMLGAVGGYLVSREWEAFLSTIANAFTIQGVFLLALATIVVKLMHELGHAYVATRFGCRVPVIGVAFMLGVPMLYCDVTDAWRLPTRRQRLLVNSAGVLVDLSVACIATFLWAFLPPGPAKTLAFSLATVGWIFSLALNLNPFMRFDGYHIAADMLGIDNLQDRAMALARWRLREILFGIGMPPPEPLPRRAAFRMALYGWCIWLYRLVLFTGIAVAVYAFFFKLAGIVLFLVEIGYFIAAPLWREIREWFTMRKAILSSRRAALTAGIVACMIAELVVPWSSSVEVPAVLEASGIARIYPSVPAQVRELRVARGQTVHQGETLATLAAPALDQELKLTERKLELVRLRQSRRASDGADRDEAVVLDQEHASLIERRAGLMQQMRELDVRAPLSGSVVELATALHVGRWINLKEPIAVVRASTAPIVRGYLDASDIWRVQEGSTGNFIPDDITLALLKAKVELIAWASSPALEQIELAANFGGRIPARLDQRGQPVPISAQYSLRASIVVETPAEYLDKSVAGILVVEGRPESLVARVWRQALKVLIRESGI